ncbi:DUF3649 domain-containing protein [Stenotrophomonas sp. C3(2023)]|uniref:DUF3649 domain-containing protein n=1 Tax=Stenotrophomonas sp. C3(2023) TaxID=3080277 RepID=UPI00293C333E|nr:DUF3649 domain-containing protein [Stenotrophomonas sp. C3(2023)]MDV3469199.1 DUF3649 domain-containing protein [Stenotrophomonas sp. C3(2023)]
MNSSSPAAVPPRRVAAFLAHPAWDVFWRSMAAIFGGYALAAMTSVFCAVVWTGARGQAVLTGMLLAILAAAGAALWAFATRSALRAWVGIALPTAVMAVIAWLLGAWT